MNTCYYGGETKESFNLCLGVCRSGTRPTTSTTPISVPDYLARTLPVIHPTYLLPAPEALLLTFSVTAGTETRSPISRPPPTHSYHTQPRDSAQVQAKLHAILIEHGISQRRHFEPATHHFDSMGNQMERESKGNIISHASHVHRIKSCIITELDNLFSSVNIVNILQ